MVIRDLNKIIRKSTVAAIDIRRELHQFPELGKEEFKTAELIKREFQKFGIESEKPAKNLPTAVCALIKCRAKSDEGIDVINSEMAHNKITIVLRADMDALPIAENNLFSFASKNEGIMHACGHDVHMAVMLGTAMVISNIKYKFNVNIKFIFQPNEEGDGGAEILINHGVLEVNNTKKSTKEKANLILGVHVKPELPAGTIGLRYGKVHAASVMFKIVVSGQKSHGAKPNEGRDAVVAAAYIIVNAQTIISRNMDPIYSGVISFGKINGGEARNVISDNVTLEGILRGEDEQMCLMLKERLQEVVTATAAAMSTKAQIDFKEGYPALVNDDVVVNMVRGAVKEYNQVYAHSPNQQEIDMEYNAEAVKIREIESYSMTVDDFAYYLQEIPGAYLFLGSGYEGRENPGLHTSNFEVDEKCIQTGITMLTAAILKISDDLT